MSRRLHMLSRRGVTLIELMVALVLLATFSVVVTQAARIPLQRPMDLMSRVDSLRERAVRTGKVQRTYLRDSTRYGAILALPTGEVFADSTLMLSPLTGEERR